MIAINLRNIKGLDIEVKDLEDDTTCVDMKLGSIHVQYCSNKPEDECLEAALQMFMNSLIEQKTIVCTECSRVFKNKEQYENSI